MPYAMAGDQRVFYLEQGEGTPLLLVHGNWSTSSWWEKVLAALPGRLHAVAYDLRGRGRTEGPDSDYAIPSLAADLLAFADVLGWQSFHLVGHSLGSAVAMEASLQAPERLRSLTVIAPAWVDGMPAVYDVPEGQRALKEDLARFGRTLRPLAPTVPEDDFWQRLVAEGHAQRIEAALGNLSALRAWQPGEQLGATGVPALVVSGALDPLTGGAVSARAAAALKAQHVELAGVGHSPIIEAPARVVELLRSHMERAEQSRPARP